MLDASDERMSGTERQALPATQDVLLEHLHVAVTMHAPAYADKITGMFIDCSPSFLMRLLGNQSLLKEKVEAALHSLLRQECCVPMDCRGCEYHESRENLGEMLFTEVSELEPQLCAQITGMLLELPCAHLKQLVASPAQLQQAVLRAKGEYLRELQASTDAKGSSSSGSLQSSHLDAGDEMDQLGDKVFQMVSQKYPQNASKITGMLLELGQDRVAQVLGQSDVLDSMVEDSKQALQAAAVWIDEVS